MSETADMPEDIAALILADRITDAVRVLASRRNVPIVSALEMVDRWRKQEGLDDADQAD